MQCTVMMIINSRWYQILYPGFLTQLAFSSRIANVTIRAGAYRLVCHNLAVSIPCTRISVCTGVDAKSVFTCGMIRAFIIIGTTSSQSWFSLRHNCNKGNYSQNNNDKMIYIVLITLCGCNNNGATKCFTHMDNIQSEGFQGIPPGIYICGRGSC